MVTGLVVLLALVVIFWGAVALLARRWPEEAPPTSYTCRSGARVDAEPWAEPSRTTVSPATVEGDLDDGRPP